MKTKKKIGKTKIVEVKDDEIICKTKFTKKGWKLLMRLMNNAQTFA